MSGDRSLNEILKGKPKADPKPDSPEDDEDKDVGPCGWVWVKGCKSLDVERGGNEPIVSLHYVYISVLSEFTPGKFWALFIGLQSWKFTVEGRNLRPLFNRMNDHCLRQIRVSHRDFVADDGKPFVTRITVEDVTQQE